MPFRKKHLRFLLTAVLFFAGSILCCAQEDNAKRRSLDSILLRQRGIIGGLAKNLFTDTAKENGKELQRNDQPFQRYKDRIIRRINIQILEFGVSIADTSTRRIDKLRRLANKLHRDTREYVIRNNLYFSEGEKLSPYLMGDNEKHLRDLPFLQDARILVRPVTGSRDSVDVFILSKDVLSIGGSFRMHSSQSFSTALSEDNFHGWGDEVLVQGLFDMQRKEKVGYGFLYSKRNIAGSFIDASAGFTNYNKSLSNFEREETNIFFRLSRPLVSRFLKWTYGGEAELHRSNNFYFPDSIYDSDFKYKYSSADVWTAFNIDAHKQDQSITDLRSRRLIGIRMLHRNFTERPLKFTNEYYYAFADLNAVLGSFSIFKQNFYKTQYIYGFGRSEDVPEGMEASLNAGWTKKAGRERPYAGINFQRYYFSSGQDYYNFSIGLGAYLFNGKFEDIDIVGKADFFTRLRHLNNNWNLRTFISASAARQFKSLLSQPLQLESVYGLREFRNNSQPGNFRLALKGESVFYSPWTLMYFRFAPFVFVNTALFNLKTEETYTAKLYSSIGGGIRVRNESLIFGTIELRGMYFPRKNYFGESWRIEGRTSIRFKYNQETIKRPDFVGVN